MYCECEDLSTASHKAGRTGAWRQNAGKLKNSLRVRASFKIDFQAYLIRSAIIGIGFFLAVGVQADPVGLAAARVDISPCVLSLDMHANFFGLASTNLISGIVNTQTCCSWIEWMRDGSARNVMFYWRSLFVGRVAECRNYWVAASLHRG